MFSDDVDRADVEIGRRMRELRELRIRRNSLIPINRLLPHEVLSTIFIMLRDDSWLLNATLSWTVITRVCHHWRKSARVNPLLWNHIHLTHKTNSFLVKAMVKLSQKIPLTIHFRISVPSPGRYWDSMLLVLANVDRLKELHFWVAEDAGKDDDTQTWLNESLQKLSRAQLESLLVWGQRDCWRPSLVIALPFFATSMRDLRIRVSGARDILALRSSIRSMPSLVDFELHIKSWETEEEEPSMLCKPEDKVHIWSLQAIFLHGPPRTCAFLLDSMEFSSTTRITVRCPVSDFPSGLGEMERFSPLVRILAAKINDSERYASLLLHRWSTGGCVIKGWHTFCDVQTYHSKMDVTDLHVVLPTAIALRFCESIREVLRDVQWLYVRAEGSRERWAKIIRNMSGVQELVLVNEMCSTLPCILGRGDWQHPGTRGGQSLAHGDPRFPPSLPHLQRLVMETTTFLIDPGSPPGQDVIDLRSFNDTLLARSQQSLGPQSIIIATLVGRRFVIEAVEAGLIDLPNCEVVFSEERFQGRESLCDDDWDRP